MYFEFDDFDVRERFYAIEEKNQRLNLYLEDFEEDKLFEFHDMCIRAYVYHDSALDGMVITQDEISSVFRSTNKSSYVRSRVMQEIRNHREMILRLKAQIDNLRSQSSMYQCEVVQTDDVIDWHLQLYNKIARKNSGKLRRVTPLHSAYFHTFFDPVRVENALDELCAQTEHPEFRAQHPVNQAVLFHQQFMKIFPFSDGTGKIGRLFMNNFLMQGGYDFVIIHGSERQRYYETLRDGPAQLRDLLLDNMESSLEAQLKFVHDINLPKERPKIVTKRVEVRL